MKSPKLVATSIGLVLITAASAVALNVGIVRATSASQAGSDETVALAADGSPLVVTLETAALPSSETDTSEGAESAPEATASPAPAATPAPSSAARSVPAAPAPTQAPPAPVAASITTYHTFQAGNAGEVVIANHGDSLEFWAAYTDWEYRVEKDNGREIKIKFRGDGELEWKAILRDGSIKIESGGSPGGGDDDKDEKDDDEKDDDDD